MTDGGIGAVGPFDLPSSPPPPAVPIEFAIHTLKAGRWNKIPPVQPRHVRLQ